MVYTIKPTKPIELVFLVFPGFHFPVFPVLRGFWKLARVLELRAVFRVARGSWRAVELGATDLTDRIGL